MDNIIVQQKIHLNEAAKSGHHEASGHGEAKGASHEEPAKPAEGEHH
jgi:hypothetical protein